MPQETQGAVTVKEQLEKLGYEPAELLGKQAICQMSEGGMGSEDFASYTYELPCSYLLLGAGTGAEDPRYGAPMHNEKVVFNEAVLARGSAMHTWCAMRWLADGSGPC